MINIFALLFSTLALFYAVFQAVRIDRTQPWFTRVRSATTQPQATFGTAAQPDLVADGPHFRSPGWRDRAATRAVGVRWRDNRT